MLTFEELEEVFEEIRTSESDGSLFSWKGDNHGKELRRV